MSPEIENQVSNDERTTLPAKTALQPRVRFSLRWFLRGIGLYAATLLLIFVVSYIWISGNYTSSLTIIIFDVVRLSAAVMNVIGIVLVVHEIYKFTQVKIKSSWFDKVMDTGRLLLIGMLAVGMLAFSIVVIILCSSFYWFRGDF